MHYKAIRLLIILTVLLNSSGLRGQNFSNSPYSRFGIGDLQFAGFARHAAMGHVTSAIRDSLSFTALNPASYSALKFTNLQAGFSGDIGKVSNSTQENTFTNASFGYLAFAFPLSQKLKWGGSFGVLPHSVVQYNIINRVDSAQGGYLSEFIGKGGLSRAYIGTGINIFRGLSAGVNGSFVFGQIENSKAVFFDDHLKLLNVVEDRKLNLYGFNVDGGIHYQMKLSDSIAGTLGITAGSGTNLDASRTTFARTFSGASTKDTILYLEESNRTGFLPSRYSAGYSVSGTSRNTRWMLAAEYSKQNWSEARILGASDSLADREQYSAGGFLVPDADGISFLKRLEYRAGFRYAKSNLLNNLNQIDEYGINFGVGVPVKLKKYNGEIIFSTLNISGEYFVRGTHENNLIRDRYYRVIIGFSLNDRWFEKKKFY